MNVSSEYPKKHLPAPFQRPSISVGGSSKRQWGWVLPESIKRGDIVPDFGIVEDVIPTNNDGETFIVCRGKSDYFGPQTKIWAFTHMQE